MSETTMRDMTMRTAHGKRRHAFTGSTIDRSHMGLYRTRCGLSYSPGDHIDPHPKVTCRRCKKAEARAEEIERLAVEAQELGRIVSADQVYGTHYDVPTTHQED